MACLNDVMSSICCKRSRLYYAFCYVPQSMENLVFNQKLQMRVAYFFCLLFFNVMLIAISFNRTCWKMWTANQPQLGCSFFLLPWMEMCCYHGYHHAAVWQAPCHRLHDDDGPPFSMRFIQPGIQDSKCAYFYKQKRVLRTKNLFLDFVSNAIKILDKMVRSLPFSLFLLFSRLDCSLNDNTSQRER